MNHLPRFSIALISAAALGYEILLMRLFSIIQWHHFAYMIISLALLGYGASGTFLSLAQRPLLARFATVFITNLALFGITATGCYLLAQRLPLNPEELLWEPMQALWLMAAYLLLAIPFFFAANCIALTLLFILFPSQALLVISALGFTATALAWWELRLPRRRWGSAILLGN